jgi:hypothetical protein
MASVAGSFVLGGAFSSVDGTPVATNTSEVIGLAVASHLFERNINVKCLLIYKKQKIYEIVV